MREFNPKFALLAASTALAMAFTLSCSSDDDEGGSSGPGGSFVYSENFSVKEITPEYVEYTEKYSYYSCRETGLYTRDEEDDEKIFYKIDGSNMYAWREWRDEDEASKFSGNSSTIKGTWTRTPNRAVDCVESERYEGEYDCTDLWRYTKIEISDSKISFTSEYCFTDTEADAPRGWTVNVKDCNNYEMRKGSDVVSVNIKIKSDFSGIDLKATYKGKTCSFSEGDYTKAQYESACKKANETGEEMWSILEAIEYEEDAKFEKCLKDNGFPEDLQDSDDDDGYEKLASSALKAKAAKIAAKAKISLR